MKKMKLLVTNKCDKKCEMCLNNKINTMSLPIAKSFKRFDEVTIVGGEPSLLSFPELMSIIHKIKKDNSLCKIFLHTLKPSRSIEKILRLLDGVTVSLQFKDDIDDFMSFALYIKSREKIFEEKILKLDIFKSIDLQRFDFANPVFHLWEINANIGYFDNCSQFNVFDDVLKRIEKIY